MIPTKYTVDKLNKILNSEKVTIEIPKEFIPRLIRILKNEYLPEALYCLEESEETRYDWELSYDYTVVEKTIEILKNINKNETN